MEKVLLEKFYNDEDWNNFSNVFESIDFEEQQCVGRILEDIKDIEMAKVICTLFGKESKDWIYKEIPGLDMLRPIDCCDNNNLSKRLKVLLMRIP